MIDTKFGCGSLVVWHAGRKDMSVWHVCEGACDHNKIISL